MSTDRLCMVFVPGGSAARLRRKNGAELTKAQKCDIRDRAFCSAVPDSTALAMEEGRGYSDIVAQDCWQQ